MNLANDVLIAACLVMLLASRVPCAQNGDAAEKWLGHFRFDPPRAETSSVCAHSDLGLPTFTAKPTATGRQLVRVSLPFPAGVFPADSGLVVMSERREVVPDIRVLTHHPGKPLSVRRAIVTFPFDFPSADEREFRLKPVAKARQARAGGAVSKGFGRTVGDTNAELTPSSVLVRRGSRTWRADLIAPERKSGVAPKLEVIEHGAHYLWLRLLAPDSAWPRIIEIRADSLGTVSVRAHLQRLEAGDGFAPDLGWRISGLGKVTASHSFAQGEPIDVAFGKQRIGFPDAHLLKRGSAASSADGSVLTYLRCKADEHVPQQEAAWRTATFVVRGNGAASLNALLEPAHQVNIPSRLFDSVYSSGASPDLSPWRVLDDISRYHRDITAKTTRPGDDFGNVMGFPAGAFGMNRLNHCPPIFDEYYRSGDAALRETALNWCSNFHDLSIWWGAGREGEFGGTRYNNVQAMGGDEHKGEKDFMWRSNTAVSFCTKGIDSFFYAYEETGDPRMATALRWQADYSKRMVHAGLNYCRDIGEVADFLRLYRFTGRREYLDECLRLFGELRGCLSDGDLFTESGQPIVKAPPFIDDDQVGPKYPYAKPYIIGYALSGLPDLARIRPDEPKLRDVVRAVAGFLAETVDPAGGWRYPHPRSRYCIISQGIEHAAQLCRAAAYLESRGEPTGKLLDAIETVLQARILAWRKTGTLLNGLGGWEDAAGLLKDGKTVYDLYKKPADRDPSRDYAEGAFSIGGSSPEGIVYFWEVLDFYLKHRPAERLFNANPRFSALLERLP